MCSVQLIFSILRHILISKSSNLVMSSFLRVHVTTQYKVALQISVCFHHSFLVASSYFSILPLVIHSTWKRLLSHCYPGASILGAEGRDPNILGRGSCVDGSQGGSQGGRWSREILIYLIMYMKYMYMFESGYF